MPQINLSDALKLYDLLKDHLPVVIDQDDDMLEFAGTIIDSMIKSSSHKNYVDAIMLMTGKTQDEVLQLGTQDALRSFMDGLVENDILLLKSFCEELYNGRR
jgi:hypothetical protein